MRDLLFKELYNANKKRKIVVSSEIIDREGVHCVINRHFVCALQEDGQKTIDEQPQLYIIRETDHQKQKERFFCKIKGNYYVMIKGKQECFSYLHSLQVRLTHQKQAVENL